MGDTIPLPSPQLAGAGFVLRPFGAGDYDAARAAREDEDAARWVNGLWAFAELGLERLQLSIHPENVASRRVAEKAGYLYEGTLRSTKVIRGKRVDSMIFSLLPGDR